MERICTVDGCDRPYRASGFCRQHYAKWREYGDPLHTRRPQQPKPSVPCSHDGCDRTATARGMCRMHYKRVWRRGTAATTARDRGDDIVARIDAQSVGVAGGCIEWLGRPNSTTGYGRIRWGEPHPDTGRVKAHLVHRVAWALWNDVSPADMPTDGVIRHLCSNARCVNPLHLEHGTHSQNTHDAVRVGQHATRKLSKAMGERLRVAALRRGIDADTIDSIIAELS